MNPSVILVVVMFIVSVIVSVIVLVLVGYSYSESSKVVSKIKMSSNSPFRQNEY